MITLIHFPRAFGVPNPSPFCMKVEILLKMAGLPYEEIISSDPRKGPKGKLPAITDDGVMIGDSDFIQQHLTRKYL
jgi:glutathione S-transferase